jgi:hypothetical protein
MGSEKALHNGVGGLYPVAEAVTNIPESDKEQRNVLNELYCNLHYFPPDHPYRSNAAAIIAAWLNQRFKKTGLLWSIGITTEIQHQYYAPGTSRDMIAELSGIE